MIALSKTMVAKALIILKFNASAVAAKVLDYLCPICLGFKLTLKSFWSFQEEHSMVKKSIKLTTFVCHLSQEK